MPATLLGPEFEAFQRGSYSRTEADDLRLFCNIVLPPAPEPQDPLEQALYFLDGMARLGAMTFLRSYLASPKNASAIDPKLHLLAYFSQHHCGSVCTASARRVRRSSPDKPTYIVAFHAKGVPVLRQRIDEVANALHAGVSILPLEPYPRLLSSDLPLTECLQSAVLYVFFHELGHVLSGHLEWNPPVHAPCATLSPDQRQLRRALEVHADSFAGMFVGEFLATRADAEKIDDERNRPAKWLVIGLIAAYAVYTTLAELGEEHSACYHSPYVRLLNTSLWLGKGVGLGHDSAKLAFSAMSDRMFGTNEAERARAHKVGAGAGHAEGDDSREFDCVTMPLLKRLQREGRFRGWVGANFKLPPEVPEV